MPSPDQFRLERLEEAFDGGIVVTVVLQTFGVNDFETAKWLSQMIGRETTGYRTESYKPGEVPPTSFNVTARDLMIPDEIMQIPPNTQLLSTVVASMSGRIDAQTKTLGGLVQAAELTQKTALTAKAQTDPRRFAEELGNKIDAAIWKIIDAFNRLHNTQLDDAKSAKKQAEDLLEAQRDTPDKIHNWAREHISRKRHSLFTALSTLVVALGLSIALPRFLAGTGWGCEAMGGAWRSASESNGVCVFYAR